MYCADHADTLEAKVNAELYANRQANAQAHVEGSNGAVPAATALHFITAAELHERAPDDVDWLWNGYIAMGTLCLVAGKPKAGKSTLACALTVATASNAGDFLGYDLHGGPVVYVAEEGDETLKEKLPARDDIHLLTRIDAWPKPLWAQLIDGAVKRAQEVQARLLVVDTFRFWASLDAERERDAGATQRAMDTLHNATRAGIAVIVVHHQRKSGGEEGDAVSGSNAIAGAVDVILELERVGDDTPANQRRIVALSRWSQTPDVLVVDLDPHGAWGVIGLAESRAESMNAGLRDALLDAVPVGLPGVTRRDVEQTTGLKNPKWDRTMKALIEQDAVVTYGEGVRNDPVRYYIDPRKKEEDWPF